MLQKNDSGDPGNTNGAKRPNNRAQPASQPAQAGANRPTNLDQPANQHLQTSHTKGTNLPTNWGLPVDQPGPTGQSAGTNKATNREKLAKQPGPTKPVRNQPGPTGQPAGTNKPTNPQSNRQTYWNQPAKKQGTNRPINLDQPASHPSRRGQPRGADRQPT